MDDYMKTMEDYRPNEVLSTDVENENATVGVVDTIPEVTTIGIGDMTPRENEIPEYMAPKTIQVNRYRLKKQNYGNKGKCESM